MTGDLLVFVDYISWGRLWHYIYSAWTLGRYIINLLFRYQAGVAVCVILKATNDRVLATGLFGRPLPADIEQRGVALSNILSLWPSRWNLNSWLDSSDSPFYNTQEADFTAPLKNKI